ncbi:MAG TPA: Gfo/Idh/MocA family oxidoreductase, partial [Egibacteraceae bacterium]
MRPVRVGMIGLGRLGRVHAENLAWRVAGVELVRVVDTRAEVAREVGARLGVDWADDPAAVLDDAAVEGVVVATPTPTHVALVRAAAAAGKHVFCEKPLSFDLGAARDAVAAAAAAGVRLQVGFHRRFDPDWVAAVERIRAGELGEVRLLRTSLRDMQPPSRDYLASSGGFFADVAVHDFDTARWMVGEVAEVAATGAALDPEIAALGDIDTAVVVLRFAGGALG